MKKSELRNIIRKSIKEIQLGGAAKYKCSSTSTIYTGLDNCTAACGGECIRVNDKIATRGREATPLNEVPMDTCKCPNGDGTYYIIEKCYKGCESCCQGGMLIKEKELK